MEKETKRTQPRAQRQGKSRKTRQEAFVGIKVNLNFPINKMKIVSPYSTELCNRKITQHLAHILNIQLILPVINLEDFIHLLNFR